MKRQMVVAMFGLVVLAAALFSSGCAVVGPYAVSRDVYDAERRVAVANRDVQEHDQKMYLARSRYRHRFITSATEEMAVYIDSTTADVIDAGGYKNGLPTIFINDSGYSLRVRVDDSHGQQFLFSLDSGESLERQFEAGPYRVRSYRQQDVKPWTDGTMNVHSDKVFWYEGKGYHGASRFFGYRW